MNKTTTVKQKTYRPRTNAVYALVLGLLFWAGAENAEAGKLAIGGYDPVAYFTMVKAVKGSESISHEWLGDTWLFVNEEHKALFSADPIRYMPNYGGYCSYDPYNAGHDHIVDPTAWRIVDTKLYLFYSEKTAAREIPTEEWEKVKMGLSQ